MKKILAILTLLLITGVCFAGGDADGVHRMVEDVVNDVWEDSYNGLRVIVSPDTGVNQGTLTVDVGLAGGRVYIGGSTVTLHSGLVLSPSADAVEVRVDNVQDIYISADNAGDGVGWLAITR